MRLKSRSKASVANFSRRRKRRPIEEGTRKDTRWNVNEKETKWWVYNEKKRDREKERERKRDGRIRDVRVGTSTLTKRKKKRKRKRMVLVQQGPRDTGKEYPRIVEDASLPSPSFSYPFRDLILSFSFFFPVVNMLRSVSLSGDLFLPKGNVVSYKRYAAKRGTAEGGSFLSPFFLRDLDAARFFSLSLSSSFYAPQDLRTLGLRNQGLFEEPKVVDRVGARAGIFASSTRNALHRNNHLFLSLWWFLLTKC